VRGAAERRGKGRKKNKDAWSTKKKDARAATRRAVACDRKNHKNQLRKKKKKQKKERPKAHPERQGTKIDSAMSSCRTTRWG